MLLSDFFVEFRGAAYNCASSAAVTDYVWLLSVTLLRVYLGRCVGLFCFKLDNAYYAPRNDVSRNMHLSIRTLGDIARKQRQIRLTLVAIHREKEKKRREYFGYSRFSKYNAAGFKVFG